MILFLIIAPLIGCLYIFSVDKTNLNKIRVAGLFFSLVTFFGSLLLLLLFDSSTCQFQFVVFVPWFLSTPNYLALGVDGFSLYLIVLNAFLIPVCILIAWSSIKIHVREYILAFLFLESFLMVVFTILDLLLFYIFFEAVLIPMFIIIGVWGSRERKIRAAYQLFLYTLVGSVLMLGAILYLYVVFGTTDFLLLSVMPLDYDLQILLWLAFFCIICSQSSYVAFSCLAA
jgi:NADH:ubiquinone oxidoreductase subunit 4 (subunit M)